MFEWLEAADAHNQRNDRLVDLSRDTRYFGPGPQSCMINSRSIIWISCCSSYTRQALPSTRTARTYDYGRFAWIVDPDGDRVEPWEPLKK